MVDIYRKTHNYASCILDAAINAYIYHGGNNITEEEYEGLVDACGCRYGSVTRIEPALDYLGLIMFEGMWDLDWIRMNLPVALGIQDPHYGNHEILIVKVVGNNLRLINSTYEIICWDELCRLRLGENFTLSYPKSYQWIKEKEI